MTGYRVIFTFLGDYRTICGPGSSVGIATELRTGQSGIGSRWGRDFPPFQNGPGAHPASCKMGTGSFPGVKCGRGVLLTTHPLLVPRSRKSRAIPLPTLWAKKACNRDYFIFTFYRTISQDCNHRFSQRWPDFDPRAAYVGFVTENEILGEVL